MENIFINKVVPLIILLTIMISFIYIGKFFNISMAAYLGYILWFIGLLIMYYILPKHRKSKFLDLES